MVSSKTPDPLSETQTIRLSAEDQRRFVETILDPPPKPPAMERARDAYERLIAGHRLRD